MGEGVGDLNIKAECRLLIQTCNIEDCTYYRTTPTACSNCNISIPSNAEISYTMKHIGNNGICIQLQDSSHTYFIGNWASSYANGVLIRNTGSSSNLVDKRVSDIPSSTEVDISVSYDNGNWVYSANGENISFTANYTPTKISVIENNKGNSYMKDLKVKPL